MVLLQNLFSLVELKELIDKGYISEQSHPTLPLKILNYTHKTQIERKWNNITTKCRGLIYATSYAAFTNVVIARGYNKFFNLDEREHPECALSKIKEVEDQGLGGHFTDKLDGSLGIFWRYYDVNDNYHCGIATRGSFTSPQSVWATKWLNELRKIQEVTWNADYTPVGEIIYPDNRIVVSYPFQGVVITGVVGNADGQELMYSDVRMWARRNSLQIVKKVNKELEDVLKEDIEGAEGYVYTNYFTNPYIKVKIKFPTYCKLHKVITGWSPKDVWGILSTGAAYAEMLSEDIPQNFRDWFIKWRNDLTVKYNLIEQRAKEYYASFDVTKPRRLLADEFAAVEDKRTIPVLFKLLDNKPYDDVIWKQIKPKGLDKPVNEATE